MSISMYQASVPVFVRTLTNLSAILDKAAHHAAHRGERVVNLKNA